MRCIALAALLLLTACDRDPGAVSINDSPVAGVEARFLGTVDGCRLWSVDRGTFYFANCHSGVTSTGWRRMVGKTTHYYSASTD